MALTDSLGLDPEWDQQVWRAQQDLLEALAPAIRYGIGYGDTTLFSLPKYLRQWQGIDDPTLPCYTSYQAGEWTSIVVQVAIGGAAGIRAAGGKAAGREFSHWIPKRHGGPRSILNGNFVPIAEHALTDPYRYRFMPRVWKAVNPMLPPIVQQWHRIPRIYKGVGAGAGSAATSSSVNKSDCECK